MPYFFLFLFFFLFTIIEFYSNDEILKKKIFFFNGLILFIFCSIRYGTGFDYFNYETIFNQVPDTFASGISFEGVHGERLFLLLFMFFKFIGVDYAYVNSIIIAITVIFFLYFINRYSKYRTFSILVLYSWFFVYIFASLRQGLAMSIFCCFAVPLLLKNSFVKYCLVILICSLIHSSSLICLLLPLLLKYLSPLRKNYTAIIILLFIMLPFTPKLITLLAPSSVGYLSNGDSLNIGALLNRIVVFVMIFCLLKPKDKIEKLLLDIYIWGFMLYILFAQFDLVASRISAYFKVFEIILLPICFRRITVRSIPVGFIIIGIYLLFMLMKIVGVMADQYGYKTAWDYPYITIFNQDDLVIIDANYKNEE